jgi:multiple sugar transport system ATP-binding protein
MDEPLSNLDAKLRVQMRTEISKLHQRLGATIIYVTHDQTEAMTLGTRIVVMKDGIVQQVDSPQMLYDHPCNQFVAGFIGTPPMNLFPAGTLSPSHIVGVRPEHITLSPADTADAVTATVDFIEPLGSETLVHLHYGEGRLPVTVRIPGFAAWRSGDRTVLRPDMSKAVEF